MSVRESKPLPPVATILGAIDQGARDAANAARTASVPIVRACLPAVSGRARRGTTGRVARTATGYRVEVAGSSRVRYPSGVTAKQVLVFIHRGTGVFGPTRRRIKPRKAEAFVLPTWSAESIMGQRGIDYFARARPAASATVVRAFHDGARHASRLVERVL